MRLQLENVCFLILIQFKANSIKGHRLWVSGRVIEVDTTSLRQHFHIKIAN